LTKILITMQSKPESINYYKLPMHIQSTKLHMKNKIFNMDTSNYNEH